MRRAKSTDAKSFVRCLKQTGIIVDAITVNLTLFTVRPFRDVVCHYVGFRCFFPGARQNSNIQGASETKEDATPGLRILHSNIRGMRTNGPKLQAVVDNLSQAADIVCLNETNLMGVETPELHGYTMVARLDRVVVYATDLLFDAVEHLESNVEAERMWLTIHSESGPYLLCAWYRCPNVGDTSQIISFEQEYKRQCTKHLGSIIIGDLNLHNRDWLVYSSGGNAVEGIAMQAVCRRHGLTQHVKSPTRYGNLLDLVISDISGVHCDVHDEITDHSCVSARVPIAVKYAEPWSRQVLLIKRAAYAFCRCVLLGVAL